VKLTESHIAKIDPLLEEELLHAEGNEQLRVIMAIGSDRVNQFGDDNSPKPHPSDFSSQKAYRQALIDRQRNQLAKELDTTRITLKDLSLKIYGGTTSRIIVVEGGASQILSALDLPSVRSASLDQPVIPPTEDIPAEMVQRLANIAIEVLKKGRSGFQSWFGQGVDRRTEEAIVRAAQQYIQEYKNKYNNLQVLGMQEKVNLESLYTTIKLFDKKRVLRGDLGKAYDNPETHGFWFKGDKQKQTGIEVANKNKYLVVLGKPGSGKSVFLRKIGLEALKGEQLQLQPSCIPVLIELKNYSAHKIDFPEVITQKFKSCGFLRAEEFTQKALEQGRLLILLDGVDEVRSDKFDDVTKAIDQATKTIENFVEQYQQNYYIISYRTAAYRNLNHFTSLKSTTIEFTTLEIADFDTEQTRQFIDHWFDSAKDQEHEKAQKCWKLLQEPDNKAAKELAQTPLLLTFLCLVYNRDKSFAKNRSDLYGRALMIFLQEWSAEKDTFPDRIFQALDVRREEILLSEIAFEGLTSNRLFFDKSELIEQIEAFLRNDRNIPRHLSSKAVFNAITVQQGIWTERAEDVYSYSHLTLQEYLTANYIYKEQLIEQLVKRYLTDERWREVFLLVAGLMVTKGVQLLFWMNKAIRRATTRVSKLNTLLQWVNQKTTNSGGNTNPTVKRAIVLMSVLHFMRIQARDQLIEQKLNRSLYFVGNFAYSSQLPPDLDLARELTRALDLAVDSSRSPKLACDRTHSQELKDRIRHAIHLARELCRELDRDRRSRVALAQKRLHNRSSQPLPSPKVMFAGPNLSILVDGLKTLLSKFPDTEQPQTAHQKFASCLRQICLEFFKLDQSMLEISKQDAAFIEKYLYANDLMVQCSNEVVPLSNQTWEKIENHMLTPCYTGE